MPVYEYQCKDCGLTFEVDQRIVDPPLNSCQMCGGSVERLISRCSFVLKGDGWYATDHPSGDRKKGIAKEKKPDRVRQKPKARVKPRKHLHPQQLRLLPDKTLRYNTLGEEQNRAASSIKV